MFRLDAAQTVEESVVDAAQQLTVQIAAHNWAAAVAVEMDLVEPMDVSAAVVRRDAHQHMETSRTPPHLDTMTPILNGGR